MDQKFLETYLQDMKLWLKDNLICRGKKEMFLGQFIQIPNQTRKDVRSELRNRRIKYIAYTKMYYYLF